MTNKKVICSLFRTNRSESSFLFLQYTAVCPKALGNLMKLIGYYDSFTAFFLPNLTLGSQAFRSEKGTRLQWGAKQRPMNRGPGEGGKAPLAENKYYGS